MRHDGFEAVIASEAKQSIERREERVECIVGLVLAMTFM
jgi:hypothetical protein